MKSLRFLTHNLGWKMLALALAILFWLGVAGEQDVVSFVSVPVEYRRLPADLEITSSVVEQVYLEVEGPPGLLGQFGELGAAVVLDFSQVHSPGGRTFNIDEETVTLPHGVDLLRALPSQLRFEFERRLQREVPVKVHFTGSLHPGYVLDSYEVKPPVLTIVGPQSRVARIDAAQSDPIDLSQVVATAEFRVNAFVEDLHVRFENSPRVVVRVVVEKQDNAETQAPAGKE
ncbi:MAG: YbbR-like domain-containing protein [Bryobacterales bacterium]|nr:YbbR-like domain-containing protein [Bryobacterales bacterium]